MVNGTRSEMPDETTIAALVKSLGRDTGRGVAVAVNGEVVARGRWDQTTLAEDDKVEVLSAIGGG
ncbi:MAG: sulfur carrier protein ThiS [Actinomycetota bacterium]